MSTPVRRFWERVGVNGSPAGPFTVTLDGQPIRLPGGAQLSVAQRALAEAMADEWRAIAPEQAFTPAELPLTRMAGTMIERIAHARPAVIATLAEMGLSDLLLIRETSLRAAQQALFDPVLEEFATRYGIVAPVTEAWLVTDAGDRLRSALSDILSRCDNAELEAVGVLAPALGSVMLAIGLAEGWLATWTALDAASLEEREQMARWGEDHAILDRLAERAEDVDAALRFLSLSRHIEKKEA